MDIVKSYSWLTFCIVMWGSNFVFGKVLVQSFSPSMLTMLRLLMIVLFFGFIFLLTHKKQRTKITLKRDLVGIVLLGMIGVFINQWSFFVGLETADPTTAALILAMTPIVTGFFAVIFLKEKITVRIGVGSFISIIGIFYIVTNGSIASVHIDKGLIWILLTMVTFAFMILMTRFLGQRLDGFTITFYSNVVGLIASLPVPFLWDDPIQVSTDVSLWTFLIGSAIVVHGISNLIWSNHIRHVPASRASVLTNLEPFVAMIAGLILLAKPITSIELIGAMCIVVGVSISTYQRSNVLS